MDRDTLRRWVDDGLTLAAIARRAGVDRSVARRWLRDAGLATERMRRQAENAAARGAGTAALTRACVRHGEVLHRIDARGTYRCVACNADRVTARRRALKDLLVAEAGGACALCGYDRCARALSFHHVDPSTKSFGLAMGGQTRSIARAREEAAKCLLVCANCHMEVEAGLADIPVQWLSHDPG
jgi:hypothetical protein